MEFRRVLFRSSSTMDKLTSIIFDCDGVLVDTERVMISVLLEMASEFGTIAMDLDDAVYAFSGRHMLETIKVLEKRVGKTFPQNFETDFRARAYDRFRQDVKPMPGVQGLLEGQIGRAHV